MISSALQTIEQIVPQNYIGKNHYLTGSGTLNWEDKIFIMKKVLLQIQNFLLNLKTPMNGGQLLIMELIGLGLLPGNPNQCQTFNGDVYGKGIYCSPFQSYAKLTIDQRIWVIKNKDDVSIQDINLTFDQ